MLVLGAFPLCGTRCEENEAFSVPAAFATLAVHPRVATTVRAREEEYILRGVLVWVHRSND